MNEQRRMEACSFRAPILDRAFANARGIMSAVAAVARSPVLVADFLLRDRRFFRDGAPRRRPSCFIEMEFFH
jgi:hypothetical protein